MLIKLILKDGTKIIKAYDRPSIPDKFVEAIYLIKKKTIQLITFKRKNKSTFVEIDNA